MTVIITKVTNLKKNGNYLHNVIFVLGAWILHIKSD